MVEAAEAAGFWDVEEVAGPADFWEVGADLAGVVGEPEAAGFLEVFGEGNGFCIWEAFAEPKGIVAERPLREACLRMPGVCFASLVSGNALLERERRDPGGAGAGLDGVNIFSAAVASSLSALTPIALIVLTTAP